MISVVLSFIISYLPVISSSDTQPKGYSHEHNKGRGHNNEGGGEFFQKFRLAIKQKKFYNPKISMQFCSASG